jgi:hypothetical protein
MFLGFPLDFQSMDFIKASVAPFGRLLRWYEGPNKSKDSGQIFVVIP